MLTPPPIQITIPKFFQYMSIRLLRPRRGLRRGLEKKKIEKVLIKWKRIRDFKSVGVIDSGWERVRRMILLLDEKMTGVL